MNKQMHPVKVCTSDGEIFIKQDNGGSDGEDIIVIRAEQAELLCAWLEIAKEEIEHGTGGE